MFDLMPFERREHNLQKYFDDMEKQFFGHLGDFAQFNTDILDKCDKFVLQAELPGFQKEDIHIDIDNDRLTITAQHSEEKEDRKDHFIRRERSYGSFARSFDISGVKADEITAEYKNGVLELFLPKRGEIPASSRRIEIQG